MTVAQRPLEIVHLCQREEFFRLINLYHIEELNLQEIHHKIKSLINLVPFVLTMLLRFTARIAHANNFHNMFCPLVHAVIA